MHSRFARRVSLALALISSVLLPRTGFAQEEPLPTPPERPRVGLVLGGGGARGAAHVGVLQVLEELRIPVDFIIGTSMGSIVGGLYATGVSPEAMKQRFDEIDWEDAFNDEPPRRQVSFRQKENDDRPLFKLEMGFGKHGFSSPSGLVAGQKLGFLLRSLTLPAAEEMPFDDLAIPYRAVATDLETGELVLLDHGDLADAIRASMAFPVIFTHVEIDGRMLIDGGLVANVPVKVALDMGADVVIAVDVSTPLKDMKKSISAMGVMRRSSSILSKQNVAEQRGLIREQDILMTPDLEGITAFGSFDKLGEAMERGIKVARAHADELSELSVDPHTFERYLERVRGWGKSRVITVGDVRVEGVSRVSPKLVAYRVETKPGDTLDLETLQKDLERVYQIGEFEQVEFRLERVDNRGDYDLVIQAREKSWGPWYVRIGAAVNANLDGRGDIAGTALFRRPYINRYGAEWRTFMTLGSVNSINTDFFQPLGYRGRWFVDPTFVGVTDGEETVFVNDQAGLVKSDFWMGELPIGIQVGNSAQLSAGAFTGRLKGQQRQEPFENLDADLGGWVGRLRLDQLDNANFPKYGAFATADLIFSREDMGATDDFDRILLSFTQAGTVGKTTLLGTARLGTDLGSDLPYYGDFALGGFLDLSGLERSQLRGNRLAFLRTIAYRQFGTVPGLLGGDLYLGASLEAGNVWRPEDDVEFRELSPAFALFAGVDTLLGPFYTGWGITEGGENTFYFFLGRIFGGQRLSEFID